MRPNTPFAPSPKLTPEEKTRLAKRFRRRANLTDGGLLLGIALLLISNYLGNDLLIGLSLLISAAPCSTTAVPSAETTSSLAPTGSGQVLRLTELRVPRLQFSPGLGPVSTPCFAIAVNFI